MTKVKLTTLVGVTFISCLGATAGEFLRLQPPRDPLLRHEAMLSVTVSTNANGVVTAINGEPVRVNTRELRTAAELGDAESQFRLARYLDQGKHGLAKDPVDAYKWASISAAKGHNGAGHLVRQLGLFLSPTQLAAGKTAAANFLQSQEKKKIEK